MVTDRATDAPWWMRAAARGSSSGSPSTCAGTPGTGPSPRPPEAGRFGTLRHMRVNWTSASRMPPTGAPRRGGALVEPRRSRAPLRRSGLLVHAAGGGRSANPARRHRPTRSGTARTTRPRSSSFTSRTARRPRSARPCSSSPRSGWRSMARRDGPSARRPSATTGTGGSGPTGASSTFQCRTPTSARCGTSCSRSRKTASPEVDGEEGLRNVDLLLRAVGA